MWIGLASFMFYGLSAFPFRNCMALIGEEEPGVNQMMLLLGGCDK